MRPILQDQITTLTTAKLLCAGRSVVSGLAINVPGGGYAVGDVITVTGTFMIPATYTVTQVSANGGVRAMSILQVGYVLHASKPVAPTATTVAPAGGTGLTVTLSYTDDVPPPRVDYALIQAETQSVRWRDDGPAPTIAIGMIMVANAILEYPHAGLHLMKVIEVTATAKINVSYYG